MIVLSLFSWWYTTGWLTLLRRSGYRVQALLKFFSVPMLAGSLFAPFRQISAGRVEGPLNAQLAAFGDRLFSRLVGAVVRSGLIIIGLVAVAGFSVVCVISIVIWPFLPAAPIIGLLFVGGGE